MSAPSFSIVIPTHNTRDLTVACLAAIRRTSISARPEIIVVDDGSSDGTIEAVRGQFPDVALLRHDAMAGFSAAANAGLRQASGSILLLLNSDTEVDPGGLGPLLQAFQNDPQLGVAGGQLRYPDGAPQWSGGAAPDLLWLFAQSSRVHELLQVLPGYRRARPLNVTADKEVEWVTGAALAMRREVWDAAGPFDEHFRLYAQDLDFCLRAGRAGWRVAVVAGFGVLHHHGATIKGLEGAAGRENPALIWQDLLFWARKHNGEAFARRARRAIGMGARVRLAARALGRRGKTGAARSEWDARTNALRAALASLYAEESPATHV
jgi:GT2 family glycosyltransferase